MIENKKQGVISVIEFPLGQDEIAVGKALKDLLNESWSFRNLTKTHISVYREWMIEEPFSSELVGEEARHDPT